MEGSRGLWTGLHAEMQPQRWGQTAWRRARPRAAQRWGGKRVRGCAGCLWGREGVWWGEGVSTRGLESVSLPAPSGLTAAAAECLGGADHGGQDPGLPSPLRVCLTPKLGGSSRPLDTRASCSFLQGLELQSPAQGGLRRSGSSSGRLCPLPATLKMTKRWGTLAPGLQRSSALLLIALGISGPLDYFEKVREGMSLHRV